MTDRDRAKIRRSLRRSPERFPLTLPHSHIRLILNRRASLIVLTRKLPVDTYEVHDSATERRNERHRRDGRGDLQSDPSVFSIEIEEVTPRQLLDLDLATVRRAGFDTLEDFYLDWLRRRRHVSVELEVYACSFRIASESRFLHEKVHRGYTRDPSKAPDGEPEALTAAELEDLAKANWNRYRATHAADLAKREARSLANQLREAHTRAALRGVDVSPEIQAIRKQLDQIRSKLEPAA